MISTKKSYGLVNETGSFLVNPGPEASEPAVRAPCRSGTGAMVFEKLIAIITTFPNFCRHGL